MAALRERLAAVRRDERAMTLVELLIATMIALVVVGAALSMMTIAARSSPRVTERSAQIQQGRTLIERLTRELRQGESILGATASGFDVLTYVHSATCGGPPGSAAILCRVTYACGAATCTRTERNADGTGTAAPEQVVAGITGPNVFAFEPDAGDPSYVGVQLVYPAADGGEAITLDDGVTLRNWFGAEGS
jgi:type II secretory pathway pseudopilin PulG